MGFLACQTTILTLILWLSGSISRLHCRSLRMWVCTNITRKIRTRACLLRSTDGARSSLSSLCMNLYCIVTALPDFLPSIGLRRIRSCGNWARFGKILPATTKAALPHSGGEDKAESLYFLPLISASLERRHLRRPFCFLKPDRRLVDGSLQVVGLLGSTVAKPEPQCDGLGTIRAELARDTRARYTLLIKTG